MKITVFGASGKVGKLIVDKLLHDDYDVVAFVHSSSPFKDTHRLSIVKGDIHNPDDVRQAIQGSDVVICALGSWGTKQKDIVSSGTENIVSATLDTKIKRVITLTGSDALAKDDQLSIVSHAIHSLIKLTPARRILMDGERHIGLLQDSTLDWTVIRSPVMNNKGNPSHYVLDDFKPNLWETISRESVAEAMIKIISDKSYYKKAPFIRRS